jgi:hypothetical protein
VKANKTMKGQAVPNHRKRRSKKVESNKIRPLNQTTMTWITTYLSILTMNVNGLNSPIKRHHKENWIKKEDPTICCLQVTHPLKETSTGWGWKAWRFTMPMAPGNRQV